MRIDLNCYRYSNRITCLFTLGKLWAFDSCWRGWGLSGKPMRYRGRSMQPNCIRKLILKGRNLELSSNFLTHHCASCLTWREVFLNFLALPLLFRAIYMHSLMERRKVDKRMRAFGPGKRVGYPLCWSFGEGKLLMVMYCVKMLGKHVGQANKSSRRGVYATIYWFLCVFVEAKSDVSWTRLNCFYLWEAFLLFS